MKFDKRPMIWAAAAVGAVAVDKIWEEVRLKYPTMGVFGMRAPG